MESGMSIKRLEDGVVEARHKKIVAVWLAKLELFALEQEGRRILVKERMNSKRQMTVNKQVMVCSMKERRTIVRVLIENKKNSQVTIKDAKSTS